jgi:hypothetical protein
MVTVTFREPRDVTPGGLDGKRIAFPFEVRRPGSGAGLDEVSEHIITVEISGTLLEVWGLERRPQGISVLSRSLFEYAYETAREKIIEGSLPQLHKIELHIENTPNEYPFDPAKLTEPKGAFYQIDLENEQRLRRLNERRQRRIGF